MRKIINAIRDFIYNITDYGLILTVVAIMVVILGWRFNILMNKGIEKDIKDNLPPIVSNEPNEPNNPENPPQEENPPTDPDSEVPPQDPEPTTPDKPSGLIATINIPEGSFPSKIGDILLASNLIDNKDDFLDRSIELGLDTRMRSGTFDIEVGTSLDNIIKIIANAR